MPSTPCGPAGWPDGGRLAHASTESSRLNGGPLAPVAHCLLECDGMIPLLDSIVERVEIDRSSDGMLEGERKQ
jgi:hypothetical protein